MVFLKYNRSVGRNQEKDSFNATVIHSEDSQSKNSRTYIVRLSSSNHSSEIEVTTTSDNSCLGNWLREAAGYTVFGFTMKPDIEDAAGYCLTLSFGNNKCLVFRLVGMQFPANLLNFIGDQNNSFYGINLAKDKVRGSFRNLYGIELLNNFHFLNPKEITERYRNVEDPKKYAYVNRLRQRIDGNKWSNICLPEDYVTYMAVECLFVYTLARVI